MAFWDIDLETRMGAESAADQGALACFIYTGILVISLAFAGGMILDTLAVNAGAGIVLLIPFAVQMGVVLVAAFRLRAGKGAFWGIGAAVLMGMGVVAQLISLSIGVVLIINAILFVFTIQGIRGAFALRKSHFSEDDIEAFE